MKKSGLTRRKFLQVTGAAGLVSIVDATAIGRQAPSFLTTRTPPPVVRMRRPISSFDPNGAEIQLLRAGVKQMIQWNPSNPNSDPSTWDPRSWMFQAYMHGTPSASSFKYFNRCPHGCYFFFPWHRGYLYFFERILRFAIKQATGKDFEGLPYWDYDTPGTAGNAARALPQAFRQPQSADNPLYVQKRNSQINQGYQMPWDVINPCVAYQQKIFTSDGNINFGSVLLGNQCLWGQPTIPETCDWDGSGMGKLERQPHNNVHNQVGGTMGTQYSPIDPIFWLHHCNIDRLWVKWLKLGGGRSNPINDTNWMSCQFTFFDENKQPQTITPRDVLDTQTMPSPYRYADDGAPVIPGCQTGAPMRGQTGRRRGQRSIKTLGTSQQTGIQLGAEPISVPVNVQANRGTTIATAAASATQDVVLTLDGIEFNADQPPGTFYEIYLNLPEGTKPERFGPYYVGDLGFFELSRHGMGHTATVTIQIDDVINRQRTTRGFNPSNLKVTLVPRGLIGPDGKEVVNLQSTPRIQKISVGIR